LTSHVLHFIQQPKIISVNFNTFFINGFLIFSTIVENEQCYQLLNFKQRKSVDICFEFCNKFLHFVSL